MVGDNPGNAHPPKVVEARQKNGTFVEGRVLHRVSRGMADTSLEAFHRLPLKECLQRRERELMALFTGPGVAFTREQLAARLGWKEASVCGRANSLVTKGALTEIDGGKTASGRSAKLLQLPRAETLL